MTAVYLHATEPLTISGQLDLSAASRAKAHATASATARKHAEEEHRDDYGRFASGEQSGGGLWASDEGHVKDVTPAELAAARQWWYGSGHQYTNAFLRGRPSMLYPEEQKGIRAFTGLVSRAPAFTRPVLLHRGVEDAGKDSLFGAVGSKVGREVTDPGLMSATTDESMARNAYAPPDGGGMRTVLNIHAPAGARALRSAPEFFGDDPAAQQDYDAEQEFTFPPATRMRVLSDEVGQVTDDGQPQQVRNIHVQVQP